MNLVFIKVYKIWVINSFRIFKVVNIYKWQIIYFKNFFIKGSIIDTSYIPGILWAARISGQPGELV